MKISTLIFLLIFASLSSFIDSKFLLRKKRGGDLLGQLGDALSKLTGNLLGTKETVQNNDPIVVQQGLDSVSSSGVVNQAAPSGPSVIKAVGVCDDDRVRCDYLDCLAHNFKNSDQASNLKQGTKVMADPELREAIANDPQIAKIACDKANLDESGCNGFQQLLGLVNKIDPKSAHANDEPRDKRSPDYYDTLPSAKGSSSSSSTRNAAGSSSSSSGSNSMPSKSVKPSPSKGGRSTDYDNIGGSKSSKPDANAQLDCDAILRGNSKTKTKSVSKMVRRVPIKM
uniref:Uncharacterized protein n=1 Tax=Romanomermis culicivorax TaxID=13658 RepID=A0A915IZ11_ROMCU